MTYETIAKEHVLKCDPLPFEALRLGEKTSEVRLDDRQFEVGDLLVLRETEETGRNMRVGAPLAYTGREVRRRITHVQGGSNYGLRAGWLCLSLGVDT